MGLADVDPWALPTQQLQQHQQQQQQLQVQPGELGSLALPKKVKASSVIDQADESEVRTLGVAE
eukprot:4230-Amphidinium_carterae.1